MNADRGYTLVEAMVVLAIAAILGGIAVWQVDRILPAWRTDALARRFAMDVRRAQAVAARQNRTVEIRVATSAAGCPGPNYRLVTSEGLTLDSVCLADEYPGVTLTGAGAADLGSIGCDGDVPVTANGCSFCDDGIGRLQALPSGEVIGPADATGASLVFAPAGDATEPRLRAVAVRTGTARVRVHRAAATGWECP